MASYQTVSSRRTIDKVYRDLNIDDPSFETDAIEWIGEAIELIGAGMVMERQAEIIDVESHTAKLPSNVVLLEGVYRTDKNKIMAAMTEAVSDLDLGYYDKIASSGEKLNKYTRNQQYLQLPEESGKLLIEYKGITLDEEGWPKVPAMAHFQEALLWFIITKLLMRGGSHPVGFDYEYADQKWRMKSTRARNKAEMLDVPQMENFKRQWLSLTPNLNKYDEQAGSSNR